MCISTYIVLTYHFIHVPKDILKKITWPLANISKVIIVWFVTFVKLVHFSLMENAVQRMFWSSGSKILSMNNSKLI